MENPQYQKPFEIEYVHPEGCDHPLNHRIVTGGFRITLADRVINDSNRGEFHVTDYLFKPSEILYCAMAVLDEDNFKLMFNPENRRFCLRFTPRDEGLVEITEETTPELSASSQRVDVAKKLIDCYRQVCAKNGFEADENGIQEYKQFLV